MSSGIKHGVVIWATAGFLVAGVWALDAAWSFPSPLISGLPIVWALLKRHLPDCFCLLSFSFRPQLYWAVLANVATYGPLGLAVERLQQHVSRAK